MIGVPAVSSLVNTTKDFIADQTWNGFTLKYNALMAFVPGQGLVAATATSSAVIANVGGFAEQRIQATIGYQAPSAPGNENIAVLARYVNIDGNANYYEIRQYQGGAYILKRVAGAYTVLANQAFPLPASTDLELDITCIGTTIEATFTAAGVGTITLTASDATFGVGGAAFLAFGSTLYCSRFDVEQLG